MYDISITNEQELLECNEPRIREAVRMVLESEDCKEAVIDVALVDDPAIHDLNRRFLDHDYPTDVLSFLISDPGVSPLEGQVVVSTETAARSAADRNISPGDEVLLYVVHGTLHLCGYEDATTEQRAAMRERERDILQNWRITPDYD